MLSHVRLGPRGGRLGWGQRATRHSITRRCFQHRSHQHKAFEAQSPVRILGPTVWSIAAIGTIYFACAAYEVSQDAKKYSNDSRRTLTFEQMENDQAPRRFRENFLSSSNTATGPIAVGSPRALWDSLSGPGQVMASVFGINAATLTIQYMPSAAAQRFVFGLAHIPLEEAFKYRQLVTSAFAHTGPIHFGFNMLLMFNCGPSLAHTSVFNGSGSHTAAFYLSGAIIAALGNHITSRFWPNKFGRFRPAMGFSGVAYAIFAAWCMENPDARVGIMFMPMQFTAPGLLKGLTVFEILGVLGAFRHLPLDVAHAAHLSALIFGASYAAYGEDEKLWIPFKRAAFGSLKSVGLI